MRCRWIGAAVAAFAAAAGCSVASAWACVPQPAVLVQPRSSGPPGGEVTVTGKGFGESRAEIRWNAFDGNLLAAVPGPDFSTKVTIPRDPGGLYTLVVIMRAADGSVANTIRAPFDVVEAGAAVPPAAAPATLPQAGPAPSADESTTSSGRATAALAFAVVGVALGGGALLSVRRRPTIPGDGNGSPSAS